MAVARSGELMLAALATTIGGAGRCPLATTDGDNDIVAPVNCGLVAIEPAAFVDDRGSRRSRVR